MSDKTMEKGVIAFRVIVSIACVSGTILGGLIYDLAQETRRLSIQANSDTGVIKYQIEMLKEGAAENKLESARLMQAIENRIVQTAGRLDGEAQRSAEMARDIAILRERVESQAEKIDELSRKISP